MSAHPYSAAALRRGAWQFLSGKAVSGLLTFAILLVLVRLLPVAEYGAYVSLIAAAELAYALGGLGLPWAAARFLPDARLHAPAADTRRLALRLLGWQVGILSALAVLAGLTFDFALSWLELNILPAAALAWAGLILAEGCGRFLREGLMGPLLQQGAVRASLVLRQFLFLALLGLMAAGGGTRLVDVLLAELAVSALAALVALAGLLRHLRGLPAPTSVNDWQPPTIRDLWRVAVPMYGGHLLTLAYSPQVFLLLLQRHAGAEAAAVFGFLRTLFEQAGRYLPATLLFSLVRPKLVASYVSGGGMAALSRNANLAGKLSLTVLLPGVAFAFVAGEPLVALLSGGKFAHTGLLFFGFMLALVPFSQRQLLETVAVTAGRPGLCTLGAALGLVTLPLMLWLLLLGAGPWAGVAALGLGHLIFVLTVAIGLARLDYQPDDGGLLRLGLATAISLLAAAALPRFAQVWLDLVLTVLVAGLVFVVASWWLKAWDDHDLARLNQMLGRRLFHV
jgi:O-antigen/teichoic acid export membrane protein